VTTGGAVALWWNARHPLFQDARVRQAFTLAINRRELFQLFDRPGETPIADFPVTKRQFERRDLPDAIPYDPERASRLLDEAGWFRRSRGGLRARGGKPCQFTLLGNNDLAVYVQDQLKRVGVRMDLSHGVMEDRIYSGDFEAALIWFGTGADLEE